MKLSVALTYCGLICDLSTKLLELELFGAKLDVRYNSGLVVNVDLPKDPGQSDERAAFTAYYNKAILAANESLLEKVIDVEDEDGRDIA